MNTSPAERSEAAEAWQRHYEETSRRRHAVGYGRRTRWPRARRQKAFRTLMLAALFTVSVGLVSAMFGPR
jgi:hypothetical protein